MTSFAPNQNWKNEGIVLSFFFVVLVILDQAAKFYFFHKSWSLVSNLFGIEGFKNYNFAFSIPLPDIFMYVLYVVILFGIMLYLFRNWPLLGMRQLYAWVCILAGAVSNIGERLALGFVRDYIHVFWGYFNLADVFIVVGVVVLLRMSVVSPNS